MKSAFDASDPVKVILNKYLKINDLVPVSKHDKLDEVVFTGTWATVAEAMEKAYLAGKKELGEDEANEEFWWPKSIMKKGKTNENT